MRTHRWVGFSEVAVVVAPTSRAAIRNIIDAGGSDLQARSAEVSGDNAAAERAYSGMLQNEDTEILGRKGLMAAALKRGDRTAARAHADAALRASKTATWPFQYAFDLAVQAADWDGALDALA